MMTLIALILFIACMLLFLGFIQFASWVLSRKEINS